MIVIKIPRKSQIVLFAMLISLMLMSSCSCDDPVAECTIEVDKVCFCAGNPTNESCVEPLCTLDTDAECFCEANPTDATCIALNACPIEGVNEIYISGASTGNKFTKLVEGSMLNTYELRLMVHGEDAAFKFYNDIEGNDFNWGAAVGCGAKASGIASVAVAGSECGVGNEDFDVVNIFHQDVLIIKLNMVTGAYSITFEDNDYCTFIDYYDGELSMFLKGNIWDGQPIDPEVGPVAAWADTGTPMVQDENDPDIWTADIIFANYVVPSPDLELIMKPVLNKTGDWGDGVGESNIAMDWGPGPDGFNGNLVSNMYVKAFTVDLSSGFKIETIVCTDAPENSNGIKDTGIWYIPIPGETIPNIKVTLNLRTRSYQFDITYAE